MNPRSRMQAGRVALMALLGLAAQAQVPIVNITRTIADGSTPPALAPGSPVGSYALSGFENLSVGSGQVNIALPLIQIGARGEAGYTIYANIDSPKWTAKNDTKTQDRNGTQSYDYWHFTSAVEESWSTYDAGYSPGILIVKRTGTGIQPCGVGLPTSFGQMLTHLVFKTNSGTEIALYDTTSGGIAQNGCNVGNFNRGDRFAARDGSGILFVRSGPTTITDESDPSQYAARQEYPSDQPILTSSP